MTQRLTSVDVFRGITIMLMTIVNNPGDWGNVFPPLLHAEWHGCTITDLVFPFFLFIVGISVVLANPEKRFDFNKILTRTLRIFLLGLFLNFFSKIHIGNLEGVPLLLIRLVITFIVTGLLLDNYDKKKELYVAIGLGVLLLLLAFGGFEDFKQVRIPGVLQRIGIVYFFVAIIYATTNRSTQIIIFLGCLLGYWALMMLVPVPNVGIGSLEKGKNLAAWVDNLLLPNHLWAVAKTWDPEGILSTIPAIATGLAGVFIGKILIKRASANHKMLRLILLGAYGILLGLLWDTVFPINKSLWTSSYVLYTAGLGITFLAFLYYIIDMLGIKFWTKPFVIFGVNPMVIFFFSGIIPRALNMIKIPQPQNLKKPQTGLIDWLYSNGIEPFFANPKMASLVAALTYLLIWFVILTVFYRKKLIFKV